MTAPTPNPYRPIYHRSTDGAYWFGPADADGTRDKVYVVGGPPPGPTVSFELADASAATFAVPVSPPNDRDLLLYSTLAETLDIKANPADHVGVNPGVTLTRYPASGNGDYIVSAADLGVVENLEVFGSINNGSFTNTIVRNCKVWGTLATGTDTAFINSNGDDHRGLLLEDVELVGRGNPWCSGMRGGGYTARRVHLHLMTDGFCFTSLVGNVTIEGCWVHDGYYMEWDSTTPNMPYAGGYYTHVDGIQFHRGKNYTIRGNYIGGVRTNNPADGKRFDHHTGHVTDIQAGDDCYNSSVMLQQEVSADPAQRVDNVLFDHNVFEGGSATINAYYQYSNAMPTTTFRNNGFVRNVGGDQLYMLVSPEISAAWTYSNNVMTDTGLPVVVSRGGSGV